MKAKWIVGTEIRDEFVVSRCFISKYITNHNLVIVKKLVESDGTAVDQQLSDLSFKSFNLI